MASAKSFQPIEDEDVESNNKNSDGTDANSTDANAFKPRNLEVDFHGHKRSNKTHRSRTDPEARLHRKGPGKPALLSHMGLSLSENRNGLIVEVAVTEAAVTLKPAARPSLRRRSTCLTAIKKSTGIVSRRSVPTRVMTTAHC